MTGSDHLGSPIAYLALEEGTPVFGSDGDEVGQVAVVLADEEQDVFDGIVIARGGHHAFADAEQIAAIHERGVTLTLSGADAHALPRPTENPAVMHDDATEPADRSRLEERLRRAWDLLSGNY